MGKRILRISFLDIVKRGDYLYHFSFWIYGLYYDLKLCGKSLNSTIITENKGAYPAQSISYPYMNEFVKNVHFDKSDVFVDVGCAWGRLLNYLSKKTYIDKYIGIELNDEVGESAKKSFRRKNNVEIIVGNALENIPLDGTVFYLFNPFDEKVLYEFISRVESNITHPIRLLYLYPLHSDVIDKNPKWKLKEKSILRPKHMGELSLYQYLYTPENKLEERT